MSFFRELFGFGLWLALVLIMVCGILQLVVAVCKSAHLLDY